jgi:hypothetical protein
LTSRIASRPASCRRALAAGLLTAALAPGLAAQETTPAPAPTPASAPDAAPKAERPKSGIWKGRHSLILVGGMLQGKTARDAGILTAPITGQPGTLQYPAESALRVDLDDSAIFGLRYAYNFRDTWAVQLGIERTSTKLLDPDFDQAKMEATVAGTSLTANQQAELIARLNHHARTHDIDITFLDLGVERTFNRKSRFPIWIGGGMGWAFASATGPIVYERLVVSDRITPTDPITVANEVAPVGAASWLPFDQCQADNDPCIEEKAQDGLTWHADGGIGFVVTDAFHVDLGLRVRYIEQVLDPGDSFTTTEATLGLRFMLGGR